MHLATYTHFTLATMRYYQRHEALSSSAGIKERKICIYLYREREMEKDLIGEKA